MHTKQQQKNTIQKKQKIMHNKKIKFYIASAFKM